VVAAGAVGVAGQGVIGNGFFVAQLDHGVPFSLTGATRPIFQPATEEYLTVLNN
jgi:hypothetical protein